MHYVKLICIVYPVYSIHLNLRLILRNLEILVESKKPATAALGTMDLRRAVFGFLDSAEI